MAQRDSLIKLISDMQDGGNKQGDHTMHTGFISNEKLADYLLVSGVIVPPCRVGDTVYRIDTDSKTIIDERVDEMHLEFIIVDDSEWGHARFLREYTIGQTTFLTREDAEKALKEREK